MKSQIIRGNTGLVGLLGNPVGHSFSPLIHNHVFAALCLDYVYIPLCVNESDIHTAMIALRAFHFAGANVTIPYKRKILPYCDILSPLSEITGAVNTLYFRDGLMYGTTTDAEGFFKALESTGNDLAGGNIVIMGNGGIARTLAYALALQKIPEKLTLIGRNSYKLKSLSSEIALKSGFFVDWNVFSSADIAHIMTNCSLLVNCTSVGMYPDVKYSPIDAAMLHEGMTVFDTIYNPSTTKLLSDASRAGCKVQNGLRMLLYQGLASQRLWTGVDVSADIVDLQEIRRLSDNSALDKTENAL